MYDELTEVDIKKMEEEIAYRKNILAPELGAELKRTREFGDLSENAGHYRAILGEKLAFLGVKIDAEKNKIRGEEVEISTPDSPIKVYVIPTNEELVIARDTLEIVSAL